MTAREQQRPIVYLDEMWLNSGHTVTKEWVDTEKDEGRRVSVTCFKLIYIVHAVTCINLYVNEQKFVFITEIYM